ncbi:MAG: tetratricopeptide repeat protein [Sandaracinaceae bacterium]|nr:tetratricopeptide repeat protein [Sandaracinaceae bacterium]
MPRLAQPHSFASALRGLLLACALVAPSGAGVARAQPSESSDQIAHAHFTAGTGYFNSGDYESALREFERAYALTQYPQLLFNLFACHERLGHLEPAIARLEQYLAAAPDAENRVRLEERLANLRRRYDAQQSGTPTTEPEREPPPTLLEGRPAPTPEPAPAEPAAPVSDPDEDQTDAPTSSGHAPAIAMFGVAGAGAVTWAVAGLMARSEDRALARTCGRDGPRTCSDAQVQGLRRRAITADVGLSVAVVGGVVGLVLLLVQGGDDDPSEPAVAVDADVGPGLASVRVSGRF